MSEKPPATPVNTGFKGKLFLFRQNAAKAGLPQADIDAAVDSFETTEDIDAAMGFFRDNAGPAALKKKEEDLKEKHNIKPAGTPPDKLPGSTAETPMFRANSKAAENWEKMGHYSPYSCPTFRYNSKTGDLEVL